MKNVIYLLIIGMNFLSTARANNGVLEINEIVANPNGVDENCEYIELTGAAGLALTDHYFVSVEGDSTSNEGTADMVVDLNAQVLGSNGLLVITAEDTQGACGSRTWGVPATTLVRDAAMDGGRLENGSNSFLLIHSPTPMVEATDYDANDDGVLELPANASIVDGLGWSDGGTGDLIYGMVNLALTAGGTPDMATRFPGNTAPNDSAAWYHGDMDGSANSVLYDLTQVSSNFPEGGMLTPGVENMPNDVIFKHGFE
ncbi:hypothetical protein [Marinicella litoralis]|uniref:LTD domain-containing protein n=1 Tax=Marinicella litoralis TaxID=644220 RepID=A0A4R6XYU0_9GAMM|nr:hypothetical protein [Marinicella litoralis]TDR23494.1 hypothetical protein C8D91_0356 [Marinicella litoralis]